MVFPFRVSTLNRVSCFLRSYSTVSIVHFFCFLAHTHTNELPVVADTILNSAYIIGFKDEHSSIPVPFCNDSTFVLDEASMMSEPNLHTLIYDLTDRHQVLDHCWYMQNVPHDSLLANMAQRDISLWLMGCGVSSPGSTTLDFSRKENHYVWFVM